MAGAAIQVRGLNALVANFRAWDKQLRDEVLASNRRISQIVESEAFARAPKLTGFMASQITTVFSDQEFTFQVLIPVEPFDNAGLPYYPKFVHDGTRRTPARPFLLEAWELHTSDYTAEIRDAYRRSVRRAL